MENVSLLPKVFTEQDCVLVSTITQLPRKILKYHDIEGLAELLLHELCHEKCFDLKRAVYLIDNPDFNHLIGSAAFCKDECHYHQEDLWQDPTLFCADMDHAAFSKKIRKISRSSFIKQGLDIQKSEDIQALSNELGMKNSSFFSWDLKHGNHGLFIFEKQHDLDLWQSNLLCNSVSLLGLCPSVHRVYAQTQVQSTQKKEVTVEQIAAL